MYHAEDHPTGARQAAQPVLPPSQPEGPGVQLPPPPVTQTPHPGPASTPRAGVPVTDGTPIPSRQKNAASFLAGRTPGVIATYAPGQPGAAIPTLESDEVVRSLMEWRQEAPFG